MTADAATRTASVMTRDSLKADHLIAVGIDSPLKVDLIAVLEQEKGAFVAVDALATLCGTGQREAASALDALARRGLVECRRFYNLTEYAAARTAIAAAALRPLAGADPMELRRLRRAVLIRTHLASTAGTPAVIGA